MPPNGVVPSEAEIASIVPPIKVAAIPLKPGVRPRRRRSSQRESASRHDSGYRTGYGGNRLLIAR
jgi:hypothetical protein